MKSMKTSIALAILILALSAGAGAAARTFWYNGAKGYPDMPWLKSVARVEKTETPPISRTGPTHEMTQNEPAAVAKDPCRCGHRVENFCVADIDCVLNHLAAESAFFIDAREENDYADGRLRGAVHVPSSAIYENIENVRAVVPLRDQLVIVYCGGGNCEASKNVAMVLADFDYTNVWLYEKGWEEVEASGRFGDFVERGS